MSLKLEIRKLMIMVVMVLLCVMMPVLTSAAADSPQGFSADELETRIDAFVNRYIGESTPGTAVVVVQDGEVIFQRGYGYANLSTGVAIDPETTIFEWGSASKPFVFLAVMQLVEAGQIDLDAPIENYLPEHLYQQFAFEMSFTVRDLMNHTAGFGENILGAFSSGDELLSLEEALIFLQPEQTYAPGTVSAYSNFGTALAAYVVSYVSGQDYAVFERENIFELLGMSNTLNKPEWVNNKGFLSTVATGYVPNGQGEFVEGPAAFPTLYPAGAIKGSIADLAQFMIALTDSGNGENPLFASADTLATFLSSSTLENSDVAGTHHGMIRMGNGTAVGHPGGTAAFTSNFVVNPEAGIGIAVLSNAAGELPIAYGLVNYLLMSDLEVETAVSTELVTVQDFVGHYILARSMGNNVSEVLNYVANPIVQISALGNYEIVVDAGIFGTATYQQIAPYAFQMSSFDGAAMPQLFSELYFNVNEEGDVHVHVGNGHDLVELPLERALGTLALYAVSSLLGLLFFLVMPIIRFFSFLRNRKKREKTKFRSFNTGLLVSGTAILVNSLAMLAQLVVSPIFPAPAQLAPHVWINYLLLIVIVIMFIGSLVAFVKEKANIAMGSKVFFVVTSIFTIVMVFILHSWNFFVLL